MAKRLAGIATFLAAALIFAAPVKRDPADLPPKQLNRYLDMCRNLDRNLQGGNYGGAIKIGKRILKRFVSEDPYAAYSIAAAYAALDPEEFEGEEDTVEEALSYLDKAIEWGFRNVQTLELSPHFARIRKEPGFKKLVERLKRILAEEEKNALPNYAKKVRAKIKGAEKLEVAIKTKDFEGKPFDLEKYRGKPVLIIVLRPLHDGVRIALPELKKIAGEAKKQGIVVLGAVYNWRYSDRLMKQAVEFLRKNGVTFPAFPVEYKWLKKYGILHLPSHLLVSSRGELLCREDGILPLGKLKVLLQILKEEGK